MYLWGEQCECHREPRRTRMRGNVRQPVPHHNRGPHEAPQNYQHQSSVSPDVSTQAVQHSPTQFIQPITDNRPDNTEDSSERQVWMIGSSIIKHALN